MLKHLSCLLQTETSFSVLKSIADQMDGLINTFEEKTVPVPNRRLGHRRHFKNGDDEDEDDNNFISKNLEAERRRREKLHNRLMELRSHVPIITNMNKATIVDDAITYIRELQMKVETLSKQLHEMEASVVEEEMDLKPEATDFEEDMKIYGIQDEVLVTGIGGNKYWLKIITQKKYGLFSRFIEAMNVMGLEIIDITVTTCSGAILFLSSVQGAHDNSPDVEQTRSLLVEVMRNT